jgi:uncharacterized membrane protein
MKALVRITLALTALGLPAFAQEFQPNAGTKLHRYTRGDAPGAIGTKRQQLQAGSSARAGQYGYLQIDVPGATFTGLFGFNSRGQTVGLYFDGNDTAHGFLRNVDGTIVTIDYPGAIFITANGINSRGELVGRWDDAGGITHSFLRTSSGAIRSFDPPDPCIASTLPSAAHGINDRGDIVGRCFDASKKQLGYLLSHDGSFTILDDPTFLTTDGWAIDNSGVVVGDYSDADGFVHGFAWTQNAGFITLDFKNNMTGLRAINERGDISGIYFDGFTLHGFFRLKNGTEMTVDPLGSVETDSAVVNSSGSIAGVYWDTNFNAHGYVAMRF